ncbi:hypothetical protein ACKGJN_16160 [Gillisia sp. Q332]|uniref:hypothetical protein n=1 Tax=Gillisia xinjiangensis TaxID=3384765 RepID=UPI00391B984A
MAPTTAQEIPSEKIYLLFQKNDGTYSKALGKKFIDGDKLNFNLYRFYFTHKKYHTRDTLSICDVKNYSLTEESELKEKEKKWRKDNENFLKKYFGGVWVIDRNGVFNPYIIEEIGNGKIVVYQVDFRNEGAIP